ncbi:MAG: glycosyltransferase [Burkholderiaceae bacterium]
MSIRICHFSTVHSGVEIRIVRKELASLARAGYEAWLVIPGTAADVEEAARLGIRMIALSEPSQGQRLRRATTLAARAFRLVRDTGAQIVHFHDPELIPVGLALKAIGRHVIMDSHEDLKNQILYKYWIRPSIRKTIAAIARRAELFAARRFDGIVGALPYHEQIFGRDARRLAIVRNFPLDGELDGADAEGDWSSRTHVAYVGSISRVRGIFELVHALPRAGTRLLLAGRFSSRAERDEVVEDPGWSMVDELGYVDRVGIRDALHRSFAGICTLYPIPNHVHSEPIKLFEYMAAGIPVVISSTVPGWRQVVEDSRCGLCVDPKDPVAVAEAIRHLREHPDEAQRMGRNGRAAALAAYSWSAQAKGLVALYQSILPAALPAGQGAQV